jgi:hypothetical protein
VKCSGGFQNTVACQMVPPGTTEKEGFYSGETDYEAEVREESPLPGWVVNLNSMVTATIDLGFDKGRRKRDWRWRWMRWK